MTFYELPKVSSILSITKKWIRETITKTIKCKKRFIDYTLANAHREILNDR